MNSVNIIGRLCADPEMRVLQSGTATTRFTLAVDRELSKEKKQEAEQKGQPTADFVPVTVWGKQAESCAKYLAKGRMVAVHGRIQTGSYEKEGQRIYTTEIVAQNIQFLEWGEKMQAEEKAMPKFEVTDSPFPF